MESKTWQSNNMLYAVQIPKVILILIWKNKDITQGIIWF